MARSSSSNFNGRLLEYLIVEALMRLNTQLKLSARATQDQSRDLLKSDELLETNSIKWNKLNDAAYKIINNWLFFKFPLLANTSDLKIDRLPDRNGLDITDIKLTSGTQVINLSIKLNHNATKHQRPPTTPEHYGFINTDTESINFTSQYNQIINNFIGNNTHQRFNQIPKKLRESTLFIPVCELVEEFINTNSNRCANNLFQSLVGDRDYYKIIVNSNLRSKKIQFQKFDFSLISVPTNVIAKTVKQNYIQLNFNNNWEIQMRLHNSATNIGGSPPLKFDSQLTNHSAFTDFITYD
jgi:hypothetical protein